MDRRKISETARSVSGSYVLLCRLDWCLDAIERMGRFAALPASTGTTGVISTATLAARVSLTIVFTVANARLDFERVDADIGLLLFPASSRLLAGESLRAGTVLLNCTDECGLYALTVATPGDSDILGSGLTGMTSSPARLVRRLPIRLPDIDKARDRFCNSVPGLLGTTTGEKASMCRSGLENDVRMVKLLPLASTVPDGSADTGAGSSEHHAAMHD